MGGGKRRRGKERDRDGRRGRKGGPGGEVTKRSDVLSDYCAGKEGNRLRWSLNIRPYFCFLGRSRNDNFEVQRREHTMPEN